MHALNLSQTHILHIVGGAEVLKTHPIITIDILGMIWGHEEAQAKHKPKKIT